MTFAVRTHPYDPLHHGTGTYQMSAWVRKLAAAIALSARASTSRSQREENVPADGSFSAGTQNFDIAASVEVRIDSD